MITKFLEIDAPNKNGRIYPREVIERAVKTFLDMTKQELMPIFKQADVHHTTEDIVGFATNVHIEDGYLTGEVGFIEGKVEHIPNGEIICIRPNGVGTIKDGIVQDDYRINGFAIVRKPA
jgi:hypothetical protein